MDRIHDAAAAVVKDAINTGADNEGLGAGGHLITSPARSVGQGAVAAAARGR